mgnify:CR=1 FL=1
MSDQLQADIVNKFKELVNLMPQNEKDMKKVSLSGLTPVQMLEHLLAKDEIGKAFIKQMIDIAHHKAYGLGDISSIKIKTAKQLLKKIKDMN